MKKSNFAHGLIYATGIVAFLLASRPNTFFAEEEPAPPQVSLSQRLNHYNLEDGSVALSGYDPVSYFNGGPRKGKKALNLRHQGVNYYFATEANRKLFEADPEKYEPAYGGWCAWAMSKGSKYEVAPENYKIVGGRNLLFYKGWTGDTLEKWNKSSAESGEDSLIQTADSNWVKTVAK